MDCAATLSGIAGNFDFEYVHKANFAVAKQVRSQLLKAKKEGHRNLNVTTFTDVDSRCHCKA